MTGRGGGACTRASAQPWPVITLPGRPAGLSSLRRREANGPGQQMAVPVGDDKGRAALRPSSQLPGAPARSWAVASAAPGTGQLDPGDPGGAPVLLPPLAVVLFLDERLYLRGVSSLAGIKPGPQR